MSNLLPYTAYTPAEKREARRLAKQGRVRITEERHTYVGAKKFAPTVALYVEPLPENGLELVSALKDLVIEADNMAATSCLLSRGPVHDRARAAIAKAEGR